jgi:hypothetical protein
MRKFNLIETVKTGGKYVATGAVMVAATMPAVSHAALDVAVTDAMSASVADMVAVGGLVISAAATAFGIRWVKAQFF